MDIYNDLSEQLFLATLADAPLTAGAIVPGGGRVTGSSRARGNSKEVDGGRAGAKASGARAGV